MRVEESIESLSVAKLRIADRVSSGTHFHSAYLDIASRAHAEIPARLPCWAKKYLEGYLDARLEALWRMVEFRYQLADGSWIRAEDLDYTPAEGCVDNSTCSHSGHYVALRNPPGGHFWVDGGRPFTDPRPISP